MLSTRTALSVHAGPLILVNRQHPYREEHHRRALREWDGVQLEARTLEAWRDTLASLGAEKRLRLLSGYRTREEQELLYRDCLEQRGEDYTRRYVALPGCSEHQTGLALDAALAGEEADPIAPRFPEDGVAGAFRRRAVRFGLILRYPKGRETVTGIGYEPWHFRYVGRPHADIITRYGLALEEYLALLRRYPAQGEGLRWGEYVVRFLPEAELCSLDKYAGHSLAALSGDNLDGFVLTGYRQW